MMWYTVPDGLIMYESIRATEFTISSWCLGVSIPVSIAAVVPVENLGGNVTLSAQSAATLHLYSHILALCIMVWQISYYTQFHLHKSSAAFMLVSVLVFVSYVCMCVLSLDKDDKYTYIHM